MPGFLDNNEIALYTGEAQLLFQTYSQNITIFKQPIKTIMNIQQPGFEGYQESSNITNFTYQPVSGVFPAIVIYGRKYDGVLVDDLNIYLENGSCLIKVQKDCRDFIRNGVTERIHINENDFNVRGFESVRDYLGLKFYYYEVKATQ